MLIIFNFELSMKTLNDFLKNTGIEISKIRNSKKLTVKEVADGWKITRQTLASIEQGSTNYTMDKLFEVCQALGVRPVVSFESIDAEKEKKEIENRCIIKAVKQGYKGDLSDYKAALEWLWNNDKSKPIIIDGEFSGYPKKGSFSYHLPLIGHCLESGEFAVDELTGRVWTNEHDLDGTYYEIQSY